MGKGRRMIDIDVVANVIRQTAAEEVMPRWRNLGAGDIIDKSGPGDLVTIADRATEAALERRLTSLLQGSLVVGEEAVFANAGLRDHFGSDAPIWVIDPIDGTSAFAKGQPQFAVMVALAQRGELIAGWIFAPVADEMHFGARGAGVWRETKQGRERLARPDIPVDMAELVGLLGRKSMTDERRAAIKSRAPSFKALRNVACAGIDYPHLLSGAAHFALYNKSEPWDHLPGLALAEEQGYVYARHDGSPYRPGDNSGGLLIAPDAARWRDIRALLLA